MISQCDAGLALCRSSQARPPRHLRTRFQYIYLSIDILSIYLSIYLYVRANYPHFYNAIGLAPCRPHTHIHTYMYIHTHTHISIYLLTSRTFSGLSPGRPPQARHPRHLRSGLCYIYMFYIYIYIIYMHLFICIQIVFTLFLHCYSRLALGCSHKLCMHRYIYLYLYLFISTNIYV